MNNHIIDPFKKEQKEHIRAATQLMYPVECIQKLKEAKTVIAMDNILAEYRRKKYEREV